MFKITEKICVNCVNWVSVALLSWAKWQNPPKIRLKNLENWPLSYLCQQHSEYEVHAPSNHSWYMLKNVKSHPIVELFSAGFDYLKLLCTAGGCRVPANWVRFSELETKTNQRQKVFFNFQLLLKSKLKFQTTSAEKFSETVSSTIVISDCFRFVVLQVNIILR